MAHTEKRTQIYLSARQHRAAMDLARMKGVSLASVVREALDAYVARSGSEKRVDWTNDPFMALIGKIDMPPLPPGVDLNDFIDETVYGQGEVDSWSSPTVPVSSPPSTRAMPATAKRRSTGARSRKPASRS